VTRIIHLNPLETQNKNLGLMGSVGSDPMLSPNRTHSPSVFSQFLQDNLPFVLVSQLIYPIYFMYTCQIFLWKKFSGFDLSWYEYRACTFFIPNLKNKISIKKSYHMHVPFLF
jgi:hypothetical protein